MTCLKKYRKIVFFNWFRNGDIHVSRSFVTLIIKLAKERNIGCTFEYLHKNPNELLEDIKDIKTKFLNEADSIALPHGSPAFSLDGTLFVNTWYVADSGKYLKEHGLTFDCLYFLFDDVLTKYFDVQIKDIEPNVENLFPVINPENMADIQDMDIAMNKYDNKKKILICNSPALSGHSTNIDLINPTLDWAKQNLENFVVFNTDHITSETINITSITTKQKNLLQIGYLAKYFDIIIGRASGPSTYCITKQTLFEQREKQIFSFVSLADLFVSKKFWLGKNFSEKINYKADWIGDYESNFVKRLQDIKA